ncbi:hypothetical protein MPC1_2190001 [Methylocella tundrae]|nr:hypothetical protein MPC1_2190001 [Methylocella tundrae]
MLKLLNLERFLIDRMTPFDPESAPGGPQSAWREARADRTFGQGAPLANIKPLVIHGPRTGATSGKRLTRVLATRERADQRGLKGPASGSEQSIRRSSRA